MNQPESLSGGPISGSPPSSPADIIAPFADTLTNTANAEIAYQFSMNGMVGAGVTTAIHNYPNQTQSSSLYNSNSRGGSAFYNRRLFGTQYIGVTYQYLKTLGNPQTGQLEIHTHTIFPFYTAFLGHAFSLSLAAGPQYFSYTSAPVAHVPFVDACCNGKRGMADRTYQPCGQLFANRLGRGGGCLEP